jgi:hypothetical protein
LEPGHFTEPRIARVDADGNIFVLDVKWDEPRLQMFDGNGRFVRTFAERVRCWGKFSADMAWLSTSRGGYW